MTAGRNMVIHYLAKISSLPLDLSIAGGWMWAGIVFEPLKDAGPILAILVPTAIHFFKFIEGRIEKRELKQRVTDIELKSAEIEKKAAELALEKEKLQADFTRFENERAAFREEQRNAIHNILCHVETMAAKINESEKK